MTAISGAWDVTLKTPIGTLVATYRFSERDGILRGDASDKTESVPLEGLQAEIGNDDPERVRWRQHVAKPMRLDLDFEVTIVGDTMTGFARAGKLPRTPVNGQRVAS